MFQVFHPLYAHQITIYEAGGNGMKVEFLKICSDVTKTAKKIPQHDYLNYGAYPVYDQGQKLISGYCNDSDGIANDCPYIVFGDHTRILKYIEQPCFIGADGVKLLKVFNEHFNHKYVFYALMAHPIKNQGYSRHFKYLKEAQIKNIDLDKQSKVVTFLDLLNSSIKNKRQQLIFLDELIKSTNFFFFYLNQRTYRIQSRNYIILFYQISIIHFFRKICFFF